MSVKTALRRLRETRHSLETIIGDLQINPIAGKVPGPLTSAPPRRASDLNTLQLALHKNIAALVRDFEEMSGKNVSRITYTPESSELRTDPKPGVRRKKRATADQRSRP